MLLAPTLLAQLGLIAPSDAALSGPRDALNVRDFESASCAMQISERVTLVNVATATWSGQFVLSPYSMRAADCRLLVEGTNGLQEMPLPPVSTYRGYVAGDIGTRVAASIQGDRVWAAVIPADESAEVWFLQPSPASDAESGTPEHVRYRESDLIAGDWRCGSTDAAAGPSKNAGFDLRGPQCLRQTDIAFDADYEFYVQNGSSVTNTVNDIENVMNLVEFNYAHDVLITYQTSTIVVRTVDPDPYSQTDGGAILGEFAAYWNANHADVARDITHLMTGRDVDGNVIGVAYLTVICNPGYGFSQSRYTTNLAFRAGLTSHELGHNWSAPHCDGDPDCYIMCSGIGGCAGNVRNFGVRSRTAITAHRDSRTCLAPDGPYPSPMNPRTNPDSSATLTGQPVTVDVLANDIDANCNTLTITSFDALSANGGIVARSVGTGPGGRDELTYTPAAGFLGTDSYNYVIADGTGFISTGNVGIGVYSLRTPENPPLTASGLDAAYFEMLPDHIPDYSQLTVVDSATLSTLDFSATSGACVGSTLTEFMAAVFSGTINLPVSGDWIFYTESDDGSTLYVDGRLVVANDAPHGMRERSGTINLSAGPHLVRIDYFEWNYDCGLIARIEGPGMTKQTIPSAMWSAPGVHADYYALPAFPDSVADIATLTPYRRTVVGTINNPGADNWYADSGERYQIGAVYTGFFDAPASGLYRFFTESDDGSVLYVGAAQVVANDYLQGMTERSGYIGLLAGKHAIRLEFYNGGGPGGLIVRVEGPGLPKQVVPAALWRRPFANDCNNNSMPDEDETVEYLDLGDMVGGGDGSGNGTPGVGVNQSSGAAVAPGVFGGSLGGSAAVFNATDGQGGHANLPFVDGVFLPRDLTQITRGGATFLFSPDSGSRYDAIRSDVALFDGPIQTLDRPGVQRAGIGMHANAGITFDLDAIRAAHPGRVIRAFEAVVGVNEFAAFQVTAFEAWLLVDGQPAYRRLFDGNAARIDWLDIPLPANAHRLTLAATDAGSPTWDHAVVADARLKINALNDRDADGVPDVCQCPGDLNGDHRVDESDLGILLQAWQTTAGGDADGDGDTDESDLGLLLQNWMRNC